MKGFENPIGERFFIAGCQRSGTTLLRLVLECHPAIRCLDEAHGYEILVEEARNSRFAEQELNQSNLVGFKVPRFAEQLLWDACDDPDYGAFPSFYRGEKVAYVVRNPRDTIASMLKLKISDQQSWLERYGRPILDRVINNIRVATALKEKYGALRQAGFPLHLVGALYWEVKARGLIDLVHRELPVHIVEYESLVVSPKPVLTETCRFLGVGWNESLLMHPEHPHAELDSDGLAIGNTDPGRSIDTRSIGAYREVLTKAEACEVDQFVADTLVELRQLIISGSQIGGTGSRKDV